MKRILGKAALLVLLSSLFGITHADEYVMAQTFRVELPGLIQLVNKTTGCRVIAEVNIHSSKGNVVDPYKVVAKREICPDGLQRQVHLQGRLNPTIEGRVMAGTVVELAPAQ